MPVDNESGPLAPDPELPVFEADGPRIKVNPLAGWSPPELKAYAARHDLPEHPLVAKGYPSIGCVPCTIKETVSALNSQRGAIKRQTASPVQGPDIRGQTSGVSRIPGA